MEIRNEVQENLLKLIEPLSFSIVVAALLVVLSLFQVQIPYLITLDKEAMILLNYDGGEWVDNFWYNFSYRFTWMPLATVIFVSLVSLCKGSLMNKLFFFLACVLLIVVLDQVSSSIIKPLAGRLRPSHDHSICDLLHYVNGYHGGKYGFVSSHATNNVGIITWLFLIYKNRFARIMFILFAVFICYSRIYLGVHFLGDVICGSLLGCLIAYFAFKTVSKHFKVSTNKSPKLILSTLLITVMCIIFYSSYQCVA